MAIARALDVERSVTSVPAAPLTGAVPMPRHMRLQATVVTWAVKQKGRAIMRNTTLVQRRGVFNRRTSPYDADGMRQGRMSVAHLQRSVAFEGEPAQSGTSWPLAVSTTARIASTTTSG
jgi:hypothetical protein